MSPDGKQKLQGIIQQLEKISENLKELLEEEKENASTELDEEHLDTVSNVSEWLGQHNDDLNEILWEK